MAAGGNLLCTIYDYKYNLGEGDDDAGGANPSGTVLHGDVLIRINANKPTQALLEQGIEDISTYTGFIFNMTLLVSNNNEIEVTAPVNSKMYGKRFRVVGDPQLMSMHPSDSRGYLLISLKRVEKSRAIQ